MCSGSIYLSTNKDVDLPSWLSHFSAEQVRGNGLRNRVDPVGSIPFKNIEGGIVSFVCEGKLQVRILCRTIRFLTGRDFSISGKRRLSKVFITLLI